MNFTNPTNRLALLFFTIVASAPVQKLSAQSSATTQYIDQYTDLAESEMIRTGVPAAISLAQGILESQSGQGWLVEHSHNHFGVKCKSDWTGPTIGYDDDHKNECFRVYQTDDSSWRDHSDFLVNTPRYAFLFYLQPSDYKAWAMGLQKAGYATDKHYADRLIQTIEKYGLEASTDKVLATGKGRPERDFAAMLDRKVDADRRARGIQPAPRPTPVASKAVKTSPSLYPEGVFRINGKEVLYLPAGTQLISIAEKYHIRLSRLVSINELPADVLREDQLVYIQKKAKRGASAVHQVATGETLRSIAQKEGVQLKWLRRFNGLPGDQPLAVGSTLYLEGYAPSGATGASPKGPETKRGFFARLFSPHQRVKTGPASPRSGAPVQPSPAAPQAAEVVSSGNPAPADPTVQSPVTREIPGEKSPQPAPAAAPETYQVEKGDTLYGISRKYNIPVASLQKWNGIEGNHIRIGQKLIIQTNH